MRLLLVAAVLALAAPAAAAPGSHSEPSDEELVRSMPGPDQIGATGEAMDRALDVLLDVHIGELADAIDPARPNRGGNETLGEMAGRSDPAYRERMHQSVGEMTARMQAMSERIAVLAPALRRSMKEIERSMEEATRGLPHNDY